MNQSMLLKTFIKFELAKHASPGIIVSFLIPKTENTTLIVGRDKLLNKPTVVNHMRYEHSQNESGCAIWDENECDVDQTSM